MQSRRPRVSNFVESGIAGIASVLHNHGLEILLQLEIARAVHPLRAMLRWPRPPRGERARVPGSFSAGPNQECGNAWHNGAKACPVPGEAQWSQAGKHR